MGDDLFLCIASCQNPNNSGALVGNDSYDLECINQCSQRHTTLYQHTAEKYEQILQIISVVFITFGLIGKVFNCIIFLRKPLRGTSTGLLLLLKTIFDFVPLLWTFIFDTKFFVKDEQLNASSLICVLSRSSDIFVSWSIGFVILACTIRLATIIHSRFLPEPTRCLVFILILLMMFCGVLYNWHVFYYPNLVTTTLNDDQNSTFTYCNILFGRQMGYFSFGGFQSMGEFLYNAPIVNFIVSSLIPFAIVAFTNIVIIVRVLKDPSPNRLSRINSFHNGNYHSLSKDINSTTTTTNPVHTSLTNMTTHITKKDVSYETTITLTTSCVFLTTNSIASTYVYVKSSYRSERSRLTEDIKTSNVYLILRMLTLIDTVLEFYIYFLTGKKFRQEVYQVISEIFQHTPCRKYFQSTCSTTNHEDTGQQEKNDSEKQQQQQITLNKNLHSNYLTLTPTTISAGSSYIELPQKPKLKNSQWRATEETLDRIESTV
ncbi:unnamed protein product [Adineta steineri]|uniref:G-protein coupled receptors family 1 profile domain-containing protein n=1 Tax=Adineta steineri TaxID=433720 RepID=A0A819W4S6_9BILA|nr:unnamed protein product [Adineta steineri]